MSFPPPGWNVEIRPHEPVKHQPAPPKLWRKNLKRMRKEFHAARQNFGPLLCKLFQTSPSKGDPQEPPNRFLKGDKLLPGAIYHPFHQHLRPSGEPYYRKHPVLDADGRLMVDAKGRAFHCELQASRLWDYVGSQEARAHWDSLAERAGRALLGSSLRTIDWIPPYSLFAQKDGNRWLWTMFDLAWLGWHPSLRAERTTWIERPPQTPNAKPEIIVLPHDQMKLRDLRQCASVSFVEIPEAWTEWPPAFFISEISDVFQASVDLIDTLMDYADTAGVQRKEAIAQQPEPSTQSAPRIIAKEELRPVHWDILKLIRVLCEEGLPRTKVAAKNSRDHRLPTWKKETRRSIYSTPDGVPEPLVTACLCSVVEKERQSRWGDECFRDASVYQFLIDGGLLHVSHSTTPVCAAFKNYFNTAEILATIEVSENHHGRFYQWKTRGSTHLLEERNGTLETWSPYRTFKLSEHAQQLIDAESGVFRESEGVTDESQNSSTKRPKASNTKGSGGRPRLSGVEIKKRRDLVNEWSRAKSIGTQQKEFCADQNISMNYLENCVNCLTQRRRRSKRS